MADLKFETGFPENQFETHFGLWQRTKAAYEPFLMPDYLMNRLLKSDFLVLKPFDVRSICLKKNGEAILCAQLFFHKYNAKINPAIGLVVCRPDLTDNEVDFFWRSLKTNFPGQKFIGPLNGHAYLGFTIPGSSVDARRIGFATAGGHAGLQRLWQSPELVPYRKYFSFETALTAELLVKIETETKNIPPEFSVRPFRWFGGRKELNSINQIANEAFLDHFDFYPLSDEENWDILNLSRLALAKGFCSFLLKGARPIGFCMAMLDYNQILRQRDSDIRNLASTVFKQHRISRARLIHIGILPEYRGQKLAKLLRHQVILNLAKRGVDTLESSYVDEGNINSQKNIQSTGGRLLHEFRVFQTS